MKPTPLKPQYVFNMKDVNRVVQGLLLVASRSKIQKNAKKGLFQIKSNKATHNIINKEELWILIIKGRRPVFDLPPVTLQNTNIVRLFIHELHRVFMDRMNDENDENWFHTTVFNTVLSNFCTPRDDDVSYTDSSNELNQTLYGKKQSSSFLT